MNSIREPAWSFLYDAEDSDDDEVGNVGASEDVTVIDSDLQTKKFDGGFFNGAAKSERNDT